METKRKSQHAWYIRNRTKTIERARVWGKQNPEKRRAAFLQWRLAHPGKAAEYNKKWLSLDSNLKKIQMAAKRWAEQNPDKVSAKLKRWRVKNPEKTHAEWLAYSVSISGKVCERCGASKKLERHHQDYSKPLEIMVLCKSCHTSEDRYRRACEAWEEVGI